jgi:hypothetical protein
MAISWNYLPQRTRDIFADLARNINNYKISKMDNKAEKKTNEDNIEFEEINDGPNERRTPVNESTKNTAKK